MCDSGHDSLASDSSNSLGLGTPSPPPLEPQGRAPPPSYKPAINPPNITPVGGVPNFTSNAGLVRPIAFRPTPVKEPGGQGGRGPQGQASLTLKPGGHIKDFAPGHPLAKKSKFYGSSQDLSRPSGPPSSLSKYSSLDRRSLARRLGPQGPHQGVRLAAWEPDPGQAIEPPKPRPGKEPERRHSSYNPSSSLTRCFLSPLLLPHLPTVSPRAPQEFPILAADGWNCWCNVDSLELFAFSAPNPPPPPS